MSSSEWRKVKLGDLLNFRRGHDLPKTKMIEGMIPVVGSNGVIGFHNEATTKAPCLTIGRSGNVGSPCYINRDCWAHNTSLYVDDFKGNEPQYLYYLLKTLNLGKYGGGSAVPTLNRNHIHPIEVITTINKDEQKAIAHILSTLDEKIEVNNQINKTLENIAQTIFKQWFVDFEFPNGVGEPYKSSGGEMVESELGMIPKGWEVKKMKDILKTLEAGNRPKGGAGNLTQGVPSIGAENIIGLGQYDYSKEKYVTEEYFNKMNKGIVKSGDVLLYKDGAQLGRKTLFMDGFPHEKCCINSHVFILRTNEYITQLYLYFWIDQDWVTQSIINLNANSAQPGINQSKLNTIKILVPEINIIKRFDDIISALMKKLFLNCNENKKNQELRDSLLPKLMSGEIRVPIEEN
jgi:type I restriction enzyme S subunit